MNLNWYVVQTKPKKEGQVEGLLSQAGYNVLLPKLRQCTITGVSLRPLFPSYLFVHTDFCDSNHYRMVHFTRGVRKILGDDAGPLSVQGSIIETLQSTTRQNGILEESLLFPVGGSVRVRRGMLVDLIGMIEKKLPGTGRVRVLFRWLSGNFRAELSYGVLEPA